MNAAADAVVLGASVDGLVAATHLAASGRRVVLVEPSDRAGGIAAREEFHQGFRAPGLLHDAQLVRRRGLAGLGLHEHGLAWRPAPRTLVADGDGPGLTLARDPGELRTLLAGGEPLDGGAYGHWRAQLARWQPFVAEALDSAPPDVVAPTKRALLAFAKQGLALRRLPDRSLHELLRAAAMPARDWLDEHFHHPLLRAGLVAPALSPTVLGPRAAGTGLLVLLRECAAGEEPTGGLPALVDALVAAASAAGVELCYGADVARVQLDGRGVRGVELTSGETLSTHVVVSALGLRATLRDRLPAHGTTPAIERAIHSWRARGSVAVLRLALDSAPRFRGHEDESVERCIVARSLDQLERAADALKYGELAEEPWLDVSVPTHAAPGLAPDDAHVTTVLVHGVAQAYGAEDPEAARARVRDAALRSLEAVAPGLRASIRGDELLLPRDLEARYGLDGGHLFGGELALDQVWVRRPSLALSRYASGVPGLVLCGGVSHPGGPYLAGSGALAARAAVAARS